MRIHHVIIDTRPTRCYYIHRNQITPLRIKGQENTMSGLTDIDLKIDRGKGNTIKFDFKMAVDLNAIKKAALKLGGDDLPDLDPLAVVIQHLMSRLMSATPSPPPARPATPTSTSRKKRGQGAAKRRPTSFKKK